MRFCDIYNYYKNKGCLEIDNDKDKIAKLYNAGYTIKTPLFSDEVRLIMEWERV